MVYRSKIGWNILAPGIILVGGMCIFFVFKGIWEAFAVLLPVIGFCVHLYTSTYYTIDGNILTVHSGFLINIKVDIATIRKVEYTNSILSAPALSLDRIEIFYNRFDSVVISPPDRNVFIADLKAVNSSIEVLA